MVFENDSMTITTVESWFIPFDILMIICVTLAIVFALIFLTVIIFDKACHTIPMMLIANTCLVELMFSIIMLSMVAFTLHNDLKQIYYQDSLCVFRGFMSYIACSLQNYSYLLQASYRYIVVIYPTHLFYQSFKFQAFLIGCTWIFSFLCPIPHLLKNEIQYDVDSQICQMPLQLSFLPIYNALYIYMIPISLIILIYFKLVLYVQDMSKHVTPANTLVRARRELKMVRRIVILVGGVTTIGFPYAIFVILSFFTSLPKYHLRIAYIFVDVSLAFVMIVLLKFTKPLKMFIMKRINRRTPIMVPTVASKIEI